MAGIAHLVDIRGADALLHIRQARAHGVLRAQQIGHQRVHARSGEEHGGVVFRDHGSARDHGVALGLKEFEIQRAQLARMLDVHGGMTSSFFLLYSS